MTIYVNHNCACGPYFDPRKVKAMPAQFGSGPILTVAREIFQTFLMAAMSPRQMLSLVKRGEGETINLNIDCQPMMVRLPVFLEEEDFYVYIRRQLEDLCACESMLFKRKEICTKCPVIQAPQSTNHEEVVNIVKLEKRKWSSDSQPNNASTTTAQQPKTQPYAPSTTINSTPSSPTAAKKPLRSVPGKIELLCTVFYPTASKSSEFLIFFGFSRVSILWDCLAHDYKFFVKKMKEFFVHFSWNFNSSASFDISKVNKRAFRAFVAETHGEMLRSLLGWIFSEFETLDKLVAQNDVNLSNFFKNWKQPLQQRSPKVQRLVYRRPSLQSGRSTTWFIIYRQRILHSAYTPIFSEYTWVHFDSVRIVQKIEREINKWMMECGNFHRRSMAKLCFFWLPTRWWSTWAWNSVLLWRYIIWSIV